MKNNSGKFVYWTPRILSIGLIAFLALFSLDVFGQGYGFWGTLLAFFMHNIPVIILIVFLVIAWKREIVGAIVYLIGGLLYIFLSFRGADDWRMALVWSLQISGAAFIISGFFFANWREKIKDKQL